MIKRELIPQSQARELAALAGRPLPETGKGYRIYAAVYLVHWDPGRYMLEYSHPEPDYDPYPFPEPEPNIAYT